MQSVPLSSRTFAQTLRAAFPHTLPVLAGFPFLGIAYGVLMASKGYGAFWSFAASACCFCGSMQFVAITLLTAAFDPLQAFLLTLLVNARHLFYGLSMLGRYRGAGRLKPALIYLLCDETFSINATTSAPEGVDKNRFYLCISLLNYLYWVGGTLLGGLLGNFVRFDTTGLDFALTALFAVSFLSQWGEQKNRIPAVIGVGVSALCLAVFGPEHFILPAMAGILAVLLLLRPRLERKDGGQ